MRIRLLLLFLSMSSLAQAGQYTGTVTTSIAGRPFTTFESAGGYYCSLYGAAFSHIVRVDLGGSSYGMCTNGQTIGLVWNPSCPQGGTISYQPAGFSYNLPNLCTKSCAAGEELLADGRCVPACGPDEIRDASGTCRSNCPSGTQWSAAASSCTCPL